MNASYILRADLLDIIFEKRNKAYGAYTLRKFYDQHVLKSLGLVTILLSIFSFIVLTSKQSQPIFHGKEIDLTPGKVKPTDAAPIPKATPVSGQPDRSLSNKILIVDSLQKSDSIPADDSRLVRDGAIDAGVEPALPGDAGGIDGPPALRPISTAVLPVAPVVDIVKPLEKADIDPSYPGGMKALTKFMERNLENPAEVNEGESVSVKVKFVVGFDGELKAFEVKENGGELFSKEVIRVLKKMPRWIPGKTNGQNVSVYFTIPVKFINGQ